MALRVVQWTMVAAVLALGWAVCDLGGWPALVAAGVMVVATVVWCAADVAAGDQEPRVKLERKRRHPGTF